MLARAGLVVLPRGNLNI